MKTMRSAFLGEHGMSIESSPTFCFILSRASALVKSRHPIPGCPGCPSRRAIKTPTSGSAASCRGRATMLVVSAARPGGCQGSISTAVLGAVSLLVEEVHWWPEPYLVAAALFCAICPICPKCTCAVLGFQVFDSVTSGFLKESVILMLENIKRPGESSIKPPLWSVMSDYLLKYVQWRSNHWTKTSMPWPATTFYP